VVKVGKVVILRAVVLEMEVTADQPEDGREIEVIEFPARRNMAKRASHVNLKFAA
jgi:hypothetical protein